MEVLPVTLLIGDKTPYGVVKSVQSTRKNVSTKVTFEDDSVVVFTRFQMIQVLES